jgi:pyridoxal phosphate enzyme (YggS family)
MSSRQEELARNLESVRSEISSYSPTLIVVTKTYPITDVQMLHDLGVRDFGENRSSEGLEKSESISGKWHYQGEIQSKKIREILSWTHCIHSLDNSGHAAKIDRTLQESGATIDIFLQLSLDGNPDRGGLQEAELFSLASEVTQMERINLLGVMSVPPVEYEPASAFAEIAAVHKRFISLYPQSPYLSAGMSGDYMIALDHGATHIRVGSKILGSRQYP